MTAPQTVEGWLAVHDVRRLEHRRWAELSPERREAILAEAGDWLASAAAPDAETAGWTAAFRLLGHKGDLLLLHLREDLDTLHQLEVGFDALELAAFCSRPFSFLSVVELSLYNVPDEVREDPLSQPRVRRRVYPQRPEARCICFYPMNRARDPEQNWYLLPADERGRLLREHGTTGRRYAGRVTQIITASTGLDDWEWGVTLFSDDPLEFKRLIYEMRFDEASARYAIFGPFFVGQRLAPDQLHQLAPRGTV